MSQHVGTHPMSTSTLGTSKHLLPLPPLGHSCSNCFGKLSHKKSQVSLIASCLFFDSVTVLFGYKRGKTQVSRLASLRSKCAQAPEAARAHSPLAWKTQKILSLTTAASPDKYRSCKNAAVLRSCGSSLRVISKKIFNQNRRTSHKRTSLHSKLRHLPRVPGAALTQLPWLPLRIASYAAHHASSHTNHFAQPPPTAA